MGRGEIPMRAAKPVGALHEDIEKKTGAAPALLSCDRPTVPARLPTFLRRRILADLGPSWPEAMEKDQREALQIEVPPFGVSPLDGRKRT